MSRRNLTQESYCNEVSSKYNGAIVVTGRFKSMKSPILFEDKYGIRKQSKAENLLYMDIKVPFIDNALNKTIYFMNMLKEKYPLIYIQVIPQSEYMSSSIAMLFKTKYGVVTMLPSQLLLGKNPTVKAAIDRKAFTEAQANEVHSNKYTYSFVESYRRKESVPVTITCPIHGNFKQPLDSHINGKHGCPKCAVISRESVYRQLQTNGDGFFVYVVKLQSYDKMESFWKIGYTGYSTLGRFDKIPYSVIHHQFYRFESAKQALEFEGMLHSSNLKKYIPSLYFGGFTECYSDNPLDTDLFIDCLLYDIV